MEPLIKARQLVKRYGTAVAVDGIDLSIYRGECFGFLGPNGAGKTSTMRMLSCVSPVTSGTLTLGNRSVTTDPRGVKAQLGVVPQEDNLDPDLSVLDNLLIYARYYDIHPLTALERAWEALALYHLDEKADQRIDTLSGGMKRRLLVARALIHRPSVLLLDEPTTGLDPQARLLVWQQFMGMKEQGITMLLCTHDMEEATRLCDRLVVMDGGRILAQGSPEELVRKYVGAQVVEVTPGGEKAEVVRARAQELHIEMEEFGGSMYLYSPNGALNSGELGLEEGWSIVRPANLEDVFLRLAGRELRAE